MKLKKRHPERLWQLGEILEEEVPIHHSRVKIKRIMDLFTRNLRKAQEQKKLEARTIGSLLIGAVQRYPSKRSGLVLDLEDGTEVLLPVEEMIPKEDIRVNDRKYLYLYEKDPERKGPKLLVSRTANGLLVELFKLKILEVESGVIEIKSIARDPGLRAKVAVKTNDGRLNPIGTCIGRSGERIQAISNELNGEHIDIILWDDNPAQLAIHAIAPAEVVSITMDEESKVMDIIVPDEDLPRAIGRNGQNVRLASQLTGWALNIMTAQAAERKSEETIHKLAQMFKKQLSINDDLAYLLIQNGFSSIEEIAYIPTHELSNILSLESDQAASLQQKANDILLLKALSNESDLINPSKETRLEDIPGMTPQLVETLACHQIISQEDLAELSIDELLEIIQLSREEAGKLIMYARAHWFTET